LKAWHGGLFAVRILLLSLPPLLFAAPLGSEPAAGPARIDIRSKPIEHFEARDPARKRFGALEFRGGLELSSPNREFGGLSAIRMTPDGTNFIAVTDKAHWVRGRVLYRGDAPTGIGNAEIAPMLGPDGRALTARGWYDTESLADDDGSLYVGIERVHQIVRFDYARGGLLARAQVLPRPAGFAKLPANRGLECLAAGPKQSPLAGTLIAITERALDEDMHIRGFLIGGKMPGEFTVKRMGEFDIVDCAALPDGGFLILERFFSWRQGVAIRLRRLSLAAIAPGAVLDGPVLMEVDLGYEIDNMEGLAVHRAADGDIVLTLVSDDNFSVIQRTLLLQFTLLGG